jgi:copper oxidase (laccase) domain-containing protein
MTKFAIDIGGVIVNKTTRKVYNGALKTIRLFVEKYGINNIYIISKAKDKWIKANLKLFEKICFCQQTGVDKNNIIFVPEYIDKQTKCKSLGIDYMIDDSIKVVRFMLKIDCVPIWFGANKTFDDKIIVIKDWKRMRKLICRLK